MVALDITLEDKELNAKLQQLIPRLEGAIGVGVQNWMKDVMVLAQNKAPLKTGATAASAFGYMSRDEGVMGFATSYAPLLHAKHRTHAGWFMNEIMGNKHHLAKKVGKQLRRVVKGQLVSFSKSNINDKPDRAAVLALNPKAFS